jgi:multiple sugar transport system ATP-binding protein
VAARVGDDVLLPAATTPEDGRKVVVGLRPQDCVTAGQSRRGGAEGTGLKAEVVIFEDLLEHGLATVRVEGLSETLVVQTRAEESWAPGERMTFSAPPERIYLFDADTGERLR